LSLDFPFNWWILGVLFSIVLPNWQSNYNESYNTLLHIIKNSRTHYRAMLSLTWILSWSGWHYL
jgi:hypothetical protein